MAATAGSDVSDGPVLSLINKRIRALRKKQNRILQMEEAIAQGKPINKEQEEVLRSKPAVTALIDELEKLRQPLSSAVQEELNLAFQSQHISLSTQPLDEPVSKKEQLNHGNVKDLLNLLYFGSLFDVRPQSDFTSTMLTRTHERGCCLTYDYVTDDATDLLGESDLDVISKLGGLLLSRPADSSLSHKNALQRCVEHAEKWLAKSDQPIEPNANVTYASLRERLNKIMSSEYFTTAPEMKAPVEVAAVTGAGNYASFQVPVHASMVPVSVPDQVESSLPQFQRKDEVETENGAEVVSVQQEQCKPHVEVEYNHRDMESNEQHFPRRTYPSQRGSRGNGGGRRGYSNGRGGRGGGRGSGYQNGRNQYYDQPGNYYPRNYYNNRGRGGRGGGHPYNNLNSGDVTTDVGVR
ncbi:Glycine-rich protein [Quillaja saponaria]|uniref:Glycine-rich protein n=1 Tax=Quillaja saponaria TaxID=32244 RepID=A0AAD7L961_QUISA|nr:Glycine-rich protein [Quillaja saponaria]